MRPIDEREKVLNMHFIEKKSAEKICAGVVFRLLLKNGFFLKNFPEFQRSNAGLQGVSFCFFAKYSLSTVPFHNHISCYGKTPPQLFYLRISA